jgi:hypothetical protein
MSRRPGILSLEANNIPGALLILLRRYGVKILHGSPRTPQAQALVEQANDVVGDKLARRKVDYGSPFWHLGLVEIAVQMNSQLHSTIGSAVFDVAFRQNMPINWLTYQERRDAEGVECENGGALTEATLSKELQEENDEEVLEAIRGIRDLGVVVPVKTGFDISTKAAQLYQRTPKLTGKNNAKDVQGPPLKVISQPDAQATPIPKNRQEPPKPMANLETRISEQGLKRAGHTIGYALSDGDRERVKRRIDQITNEKAAIEGQDVSLGEIFRPFTSRNIV